MAGSIRPHYRWLIAASIGTLAIVVLLVAIAAVAPPLSSESARARLIAALSERLDGEVDLGELRLQVVPRLRAEGRGLTVRHRGRRDVPPLITIAHFSAEGSVVQLYRGHVARVTLDGLDIQIPPDRNRDDDDHDDEAPDAAKGDGRPRHDVVRGLTIDELHSSGARLTIIPREENKPPKVWDIHDLRMTSVSPDAAMPFEATLTNAIPPGEIATRGTFGPWQSGEPGRTPLGGTFTFDRADLSVFKGISGVLSAHGEFGGLLERIDIHGETETPLFQITSVGQPVPLRTKYHAIADGTNGNTILERIDASFLRTSIVATGGVVGVHGRDGRTVTLNVAITRGRLEDVLKLAVKAKNSPMIGALRLNTTFVLPPGETDVVRRLRLNGRFSMEKTRFTNLDVQGKINELSHRSRPRTDSPEANQEVTSRFTGRFGLGGGTLSIPDVTFDVPGAVVQLAGTYALVPETIDFKGTLFMDVKISQTVTGFKSLLLKAVDPFFRRQGGGSAIPIKITGDRSQPSFGLDRGRVFRRKSGGTDLPAERKSSAGVREKGTR